MPVSEIVHSLPDTEKWIPRANGADVLKLAFRNRCSAIEETILSKVTHERKSNIDNFDSGPGVEDIIRDELSKLLPTRYSVRAGVVNDRLGNTAGDCDVVIYNDTWFPIVKAGAAANSRRIHLAIEGAYAIGEIKQTLDFTSLDHAMEKLVVCHRLHRPPTYAYRLVENRESSPCSHGLTNPLFSFIIATDIKPSIEFEDLVERFFYINRTLRRHEVIRALCVLGHGTITWGFVDKENEEIRPALFMLEDLYEPIYPVFHRVANTDSALYPLMVDLLLHLYKSVLAPEDIAPYYGSKKPGIVSIPKSPDISLPPDPERLDSLRQFCSMGHNKTGIASKGRTNQKRHHRSKYR
jgi:hypothetical protein